MFRESFLRIARDFALQPNRSWYELARDPEKAERWWGGLLRHIDEAVRAGATEEQLLEIPSLFNAYILTRLAERDLTPAEGVVAIPLPLKRAA